MATQIFSSSHLPRTGRLPAVSGLVERMLGWLERKRQRRELLEMSDSLLKDIGISRADAWHEGSKPFWKD